MNTEFIAIPHEDKTRVDMALFLPQRKIPSVFIEIKAVGKMLSNLPEIERQTRDYNRNNTAPISIITDGRYWRFYLSQVGGEFSQKCFLDFDLLDDSKPEDDFISEFTSFLSESEILSERAIVKAREYLLRTQTERNMIEALLRAKKDHESQYISRSLVELFQERLADVQINISKEDAIKFIEDNTTDPPLTPPLTPKIFDNSLNYFPQPPPSPHLSIQIRDSKNYRGHAGKARTPDARAWVQHIDELKSIPNLTTWQAICDHLNIPVEGDSARRRLIKWVEKNRPNWPHIPEPQG